MTVTTAARPGTHPPGEDLIRVGRDSVVVLGGASGPTPPSASATTSTCSLRISSTGSTRAPRSRRRLRRHLPTAAARHVRREDGPSTQNRIRQLEEQSELVRAWQPTLVPGQLQTWDYTCAVIEGEPPPDHPWTVRRLARVDLLNDEHRRYELVMSEAALRWVVGSRQIMTAQLEHLIELSHRPNLDIAVVPFGQTILPPPEGSFHLFGERSATTATDIGTTFTDDRSDLDGLAALHRRLMDAALHGDEVRALMSRVRER